MACSPTPDALHGCPDCGAPLAESGGPRRLTCPSCQGAMYGLSPFEHMLDQGAGSHLWVASADGSRAGPCPYCSAPMRRPDAPFTDAAEAGLAFCRTCQEVWVPEAAGAWMAAHRPSGPVGPPPSRPATPAECANCGAPYAPDDAGHCRYCHAQIGAPQPIVVVVDNPQPF